MVCVSLVILSSTTWTSLGGQAAPFCRWYSCSTSASQLAHAIVFCVLLVRVPWAAGSLPSGNSALHSPHSNTAVLVAPHSWHRGHITSFFCWVICRHGTGRWYGCQTNSSNIGNTDTASTSPTQNGILVVMLSPQSHHRQKKQYKKTGGWGRELVVTLSHQTHHRSTANKLTKNAHVTTCSQLTAKTIPDATRTSSLRRAVWPYGCQGNAATSTTSHTAGTRTLPVWHVRRAQRTGTPCRSCAARARGCPGNAATSTAFRTADTWAPPAWGGRRPRHRLRTLCCCRCAGWPCGCPGSAGRSTASHTGRTRTPPSSRAPWHSGWPSSAGCTATPRTPHRRSSGPAGWTRTRTTDHRHELKRRSQTSSTSGRPLGTDRQDERHAAEASSVPPPVSNPGVSFEHAGAMKTAQQGRCNRGVSV